MPQDQNMTANQLVELTIKTEIARISKIGQVSGAATALNKALTELLQKQCSVCKMIGHTRSYCWLNGQMYAQLRDNHDAHVAWTYSKKFATMEAKQTHHRDVAKAMVEFE